MKRKANNSKAIKTEFLYHEQLIIKGRLMEFEGWLDAARECRSKFGGNASAYARASVTESHSVATIRQYVGVALKAINKWGDKLDSIRNEFEFGKKTGYAYTNMDDLRSFLNKGNAKSTPKTSKQATVKTTKRKARNAWDKAQSFDEFWELMNK